MLERLEAVSSPRVFWTQRHVPISANVCSNVEGYRDPFRFVERDLDALVGTMVTYMQYIAKKIGELANEHWGEVYEAEINSEQEDGSEDSNDGTRACRNLVPSCTVVSRNTQHRYRYLVSNLQSTTWISWNENLLSTSICTKGKMLSLKRDRISTRASLQDSYNF